MDKHQGFSFFRVLDGIGPALGLNIVFRPEPGCGHPVLRARTGQMSTGHLSFSVLAHLELGSDKSVRNGFEQR